MTRVDLVRDDAIAASVDKGEKRPAVIGEIPLHQLLSLSWGSGVSGSLLSRQNVALSL